MSYSILLFALLLGLTLAQEQQEPPKQKTEEEIIQLRDLDRYCRKSDTQRILQTVRDECSCDELVTMDAKLLYIEEKVFKIFLIMILLVVSVCCCSCCVSGASKDYVREYYE